MNESGERELRFKEKHDLRDAQRTIRIYAVELTLKEQKVPVFACLSCKAGLTGVFKPQIPLRLSPTLRF